MNAGLSCILQASLLPHPFWNNWKSTGSRLPARFDSLVLSGYQNILVSENLRKLMSV
jgi:hypothetical protein